jgi:N utilization substance protein A
MESVNLIESFSEFKDIKNIDRVTLMSIIEDVFRSMLIKRFGSDKNFDIIVNPDKGDVEIYKNRTIVDDDFAEDSFDYDENKHISLSDAHKIEPDFEIGEDVSEKVKLEDFGRRAVLSVRQNLVQKSSNWKRAKFITNTKKKWEMLLLLRYTRYGKKKLC